jgi:hypothetical protein
MNGLLLVVSLLFPLGSWANATDSVPPSLYKMFSQKEFDLDSYLETSPIQLQAQSCHYKSFVTKKEVDYAGVGACLYQSLIDGLYSDEIPGVITAHFKIMTTNENATVAVVWRPAKGGVFHVAKKAFRDWRRKPDIGETDTLMGTLVFDFSATDPTAVADLFGPFGVLIPDDLAQVQLTAHPRLGDETITDTLVVFKSRSKKDISKIYWDWNFFIIPPSDDVTLSVGTIK